MTTVWNVSRSDQLRLQSEHEVHEVTYHRVGDLLSAQAERDTLSDLVKVTCGCLGSRSAPLSPEQIEDAFADILSICPQFIREQDNTTLATGLVSMVSKMRGQLAETREDLSKVRERLGTKPGQGTLWRANQVMTRLEGLERALETAEEHNAEVRKILGAALVETTERAAQRAMKDIVELRETLTAAQEINQEQLDAPKKLEAERDEAKAAWALSQEELEQVRFERDALRRTLDLLARNPPFVDRLQDMAEAAGDLAIGTARLVKDIGCLAWHAVFHPEEPWRPAPFKPEAKTTNHGDAP